MGFNFWQATGIGAAAEAIGEAGQYVEESIGSVFGDETEKQKREREAKEKKAQQTLLTAQEKDDALTEELMSWMREDRTDAEIIKYNLSMLEPMIYSQMGLKVEKDESGKITSWSKMSEEELLGSMNSMERLQYDITKKTSESTLLALEGKLPIPKTTEDEISKQRTQLAETLSRRLGPDWAITTTEIQEMNDFDTQANMLRTDYSTGQVTTMSGINLAQQGGAVQSREATTRGILSGGTISMPGLAT